MNSEACALWDPFPTGEAATVRKPSTPTREEPPLATAREEHTEQQLKRRPSTAKNKQMAWEMENNMHQIVCSSVVRTAQQEKVEQGEWSPGVRPSVARLRFQSDDPQEASPRRLRERASQVSSVVSGEGRF